MRAYAKREGGSAKEGKRCCGVRRTKLDELALNALEMSLNYPSPSPLLVAHLAISNVDHS